MIIFNSLLVYDSCVSAKGRTPISVMVVIVEGGKRLVCKHKLAARKGLKHASYAGVLPQRSPPLVPGSLRSSRDLMCNIVIAPEDTIKLHRVVRIPEDS